MLREKSACEAGIANLIAAIKIVPCDLNAVDQNGLEFLYLKPARLPGPVTRAIVELFDTPAN